MISYQDDGKGKSQSHEANLELEGRSLDGHNVVTATSYGASKEEAKRNLRDCLTKIIEALQQEIGSLENTGKE